MLVLSLVTIIRLRAQNKSGGANVEARLILSALLQTTPVLLSFIFSILAELLKFFVGTNLIGGLASEYSQDISFTISPLILIATSSQVRKSIACLVQCKQFVLAVPNNNKKPAKRPNKPNA